MIDYGLAGQVTVVIAVAVPALVHIVRAAKPPARKTVEQEQTASREVVSAIPQWQWRALNDVSDPTFATVHEISPLSRNWE
jgi:hypothetical protein